MIVHLSVGLEGRFESVDDFSVLNDMDTSFSVSGLESLVKEVLDKVIRLTEYATYSKPILVV